MLKVLSLGAGVQSTTVLLMSCMGELPGLDAAVFADTGWEPPEVYKHLEWLKTYARRAGLPVHIVSKGNIREDALISQVRGTKEIGKRWASMPFFTLKVWTPDHQKELKALIKEEREKGNDVTDYLIILRKIKAGETVKQRGMIRRQCTSEYKIKPLERFVRHKLLGLEPRQRAKPGSVQTWIGISADEKQRVRKSFRPWQELFYPLLGLVSLSKSASLFRATPTGFTRADCVTWLERNGFPKAPRSACIGCPFHNDEEWLRIKADPVQWEDACQFDEAIRNCGGMRGQIFIHEDRIPLREVQFDPKKRKWGVADNECQGMCGA